MDTNIISLISILIIGVGVLGTFMPVLPGLILSFAGVLLYKFLANPEFSWVYVGIFGALVLVSSILNYIIPMKVTKKYGGSNYGSIGGFLGTLVGLFFIPIPFGFLIGMILGVFAGEMLHDKTDKQKAYNATKGALIGFLYGTGFNLVVGMAMFSIVLIDFIRNIV